MIGLNKKQSSLGPGYLCSSWLIMLIKVASIDHSPPQRVEQTVNIILTYYHCILENCEEKRIDTTNSRQIRRGAHWKHKRNMLALFQLC